MAADEFRNSKLAWLRYAIVWIAYAWMRATVHLPLGLQLTLARSFGRAARFLVPKRRRVVAANLAACFPELSAEAREHILVEHFASLGASLVEMTVGWFGSPERNRARIRVEGAEHLRTAVAQNRGVILLSAHFTTFEFYWAALKPLCPRLCAMFKWQTNPVMNDVMNRGRLRYFDALYPKDNVRDLLRALRDKSVVWYASDQSYLGKGSTLLPFFGEPAMTNTAIARIAKAGDAIVLPFFCRRLPDDTYVMTIGAPMPNFPSGDDVGDTLRFVAELERYIRLCPEQYWWIHQRFKGRPAELPDLYASPRASA